ncbi:MAG: hypothetical protein K5637_00385 [Lachnospiraceae bacterium]|nr:hypothetical protein [Lachnospiraceae bacterium]
MSFNTHDISRDACQLFGGQASCGYDWWWHSFTGRSAETGEERPFFIEFFVCNPALGGDAPILGQLPENKAKGRRPSYLMVKAGAWGEGGTQLHRFFGWNNIKVSMDVPYSVSAEDCYAAEDRLKGHVRITDAAKHPEWMCGDGEMSWDLELDKDITWNVGYGAGKLFRKLQLFEMFWHAEGMRTRYKGEVIFNGVRYIVSPENCYGYSDKNWGKDFTSPWVWISSNNLTSELTGKKLENSAFDIGGGAPKVGPVRLKRKLLSCFWYEGTPFEFNFSKFWTFTRTKFWSRETDTKILWYVEQCNLRDRMVTKLVCDKKDMLFVNYESPKGEKRYSRLWNGGNGRGVVSLYRDGKLVDRIRVRNTGCEYGEFDS